MLTVQILSTCTNRGEQFPRQAQCYFTAVISGRPSPPSIHTASPLPNLFFALLCSARGCPTSCPTLAPCRGLTGSTSRKEDGEIGVVFFPRVACAEGRPGFLGGSSSALGDVSSSQTGGTWPFFTVTIKSGLTSCQPPD